MRGPLRWPVSLAAAPFVCPLSLATNAQLTTPTLTVPEGPGGPPNQQFLEPRAADPRVGQPSHRESLWTIEFN